jgi:hypothetical protein
LPEVKELRIRDKMPKLFVSDDFAEEVEAFGGYKQRHCKGRAGASRCPNRWSPGSEIGTFKKHWALCHKDEFAALEATKRSAAAALVPDSPEDASSVMDSEFQMGPAAAAASSPALTPSKRPS